jgi:hypothetical protein
MFGLAIGTLAMACSRTQIEFDPLEAEGDSGLGGGGGSGGGGALSS